VETCSDTVRTQRWQLVADHGGRLHLVNAISQLALTESADGTAVQLPPDTAPPTELTAQAAG
jgi:hexosaminidase